MNLSESMGQGLPLWIVVPVISTGLYMLMELKFASKMQDAHLGRWFQSKYFSMSFRLHINMHSLSSSKSNLAIYFHECSAS